MGITRYLDCASLKHHGKVSCFVKTLKLWGEINKLQCFLLENNDASLPYTDIGAIPTS